MRVITPVSKPNAWVKNRLKNRELITKYKNYNRCCYLLSNGKRCSRPAKGATTVDKGENVKKLKAKKGGNLFNKIAMVKNCQARRIEYPKKCMMGCIKDPGSKRSKSAMQKRMHQHDFITNKLKEMEHLLLYGNKRISSPRRVQNNNVSYKLRNK